MSKSVRRVVGAIVSVLAIAVTSAGLAWACSPDANISLSEESGPSGQQVTVTGRQFAPGATVEIRWNALSGTELVRAEGPEFSVAVTIPASQPDDARIYAIARNANGEVLGTASSVYWVGGKPASSAPPERQTTTQTTEGTTIETAGGRSPVGSQDRGQDRETTGATRSTGASRDSVSTRSRAREPSDSAPVTRAVVAPVATAEPVERTLVAPLATASAEPSRARAAPKQRASRSEPTRRPPAARKPSTQSAIGDLWSGFQGGSSPSLSTSIGGGVVGAGSSNQIGLGVGLLGFGLVTLFAGALLVSLRRRRALVQGERTDS